ncbi:MAG TPA: SDR family NAD(P)-dependent oxidoreductase [Acetobacteraceae bacterium]|jgi:NAD(P)-dependent dehydrogenase (short-subunit alcohol dehydrogenase family)|nr:SDR family NAD(P)-dependent oxidoreductase [Acetobacteraceae bacterium]
MGKLAGKVAIVTGASRGIGQQIAELFASEGAKVICAARTLNEGDHRMLEGSLSRTVELIRGKGGEATAVTADVSLEQDCIALVQAGRLAYGPIDILVNNAALNYYLPTETYPTSRWVRCFAVNVHAPFILAKEVLADMIPRRSGAIVNISSGSAIGPGRGPYDDKTAHGGVMYGATKAALERFTQGLGQEVAQYDGITVAAVSPSQVVPTPGTIHHKLVNGIDDPRGEPPMMMARAALLLASEAAEKVNGRVTYSQQILKEFGWIEGAKGRGVTIRGSGYSLV